MKLLVFFIVRIKLNLDWSLLCCLTPRINVRKLIKTKTTSTIVPIFPRYGAFACTCVQRHEGRGGGGAEPSPLRGNTHLAKRFNDLLVFSRS